MSKVVEPKKKGCKVGKSESTLSSPFDTIEMAKFCGWGVN